MGELEATEQEEFSNIPVAELVSNAEEQDLKDDVCGDFNKIEWGARSLIESSATRLTPKYVVAQAGFTLQRRNTGRLTVRAMH